MEVGVGSRCSCSCVVASVHGECEDTMNHTCYMHFNIICIGIRKWWRTLYLRERYIRGSHEETVPSHKGRRSDESIKLSRVPPPLFDHDARDREK